jgi:hypothetical protein
VKKSRKDKESLACGAINEWTKNYLASVRKLLLILGFLWHHFSKNRKFPHHPGIIGPIKSMMIT